MNAKTLVVAQTRLPRVITPLVPSRAHVPLVTTQIIKADVKVTAVLIFCWDPCVSIYTCTNAWQKDLSASKRMASNN